MRIVVTFLLNAGLNFAIGLVVAAILGPQLYGHYAVWASAGALIATGLFEWLRLSTARFYGESQRLAAPALRPSLDAAYRILMALVAGGGLIALGLPDRFGLNVSLVGAVVLTALANGAFDFRTALARACFRDRDYAVLVIGKGALGLVCAAAVAVLTRDPALVLGAQALGTWLATLPVRRGLAHAGAAKPETPWVKRFATYGLPVVAANVLFQSMLLMNRSVAASRFGYAAAGHLSLATDIELRILLAVGAAVDVLVFQLAVRSEAVGGARAAAAQVRTNMVHVAAVVLLLAIGFAMTLPAFAALVVPARFRDGFAPLALAMLPGMALFCLGQFAVNPVFQMAHRTAPIIAGALAAIGVDAAGLALVPAEAGPLGIAAVHSASLACGTLVLGALAWRDPAMRPPGREAWGLLVAGLAAVVALWPLRSLASPALVLSGAALVGPAVYGAMLVLLDVGGIRRMVAPVIGRLARRTGREGLA